MKNNIVVRKRIGGVWGITCLLFIFLTGCGVGNNKDVTTISLQKDGKVVQTIVEDFSKEQYDINEFQKMNENTVSYFNENMDREAVTIHSMHEEEGTLKVVMDYANANDYYEFNAKLLYVGTIEQANTAGYDLNQSYTDVKSGESVTVDKALEKTGHHVAIVSEPVDVETFAGILYVSDGVTLKEKRKATVSEDTQGYIIFK